MKARFIALWAAWVNIVLVVPQSANAQSSMREYLTGNRTYYVRMDGSDSNNGLSNNSGGAWHTIQHAIDVVSKTIDFAGFQVTIQIDDGMYTDPIVCQAPMTGAASLTAFSLNGDSSNPSSVALNITTPFVGIQISDGCQIRMSNFTVQVSNGATGATAAIWATRSGQISFGEGMVFGSSPGAVQIWVTDHGRVMGANRTVSGGGSMHVHVDTMGVFFDFDNTVTFSGSPSFTTVYDCYLGGIIETSGMKYSGSVSGKRFSGQQNCIISTGNSGNWDYFPGTIAGTLDPGVVYDTYSAAP